ncbi:MAG: adventurous gliding motility protein GltC [Myxococcaceae bacterium]
MKKNLLIWSLLVAWVVPEVAVAQMNFEGLDLNKKKKKKKKADDTKKDDTKKDDSSGTGDTAVPLPAEGLDLTKTGKDDKKDEKKPAGTAATMTFDTVDVAGKTADRQKLDAASNEFRNENYEAAALQSYDIMTDPKYAGLGTEAQYLLAKSLYRMGLYHSALSQFSQVLAKGPQTKFFKSSLEWLFFISRKTVNEAVVLDELAKYSNFDFPDKFKNEFRYLLARYYFVRGHALDEADQKGEANKSFDEVKRLVLMIPKGDPFWPRAKYLEGLAYFREDKAQTALDSMKEVVKATRFDPKAPITPEVRANKQLRELALMQLARTHYGANQPGYANFDFRQIERGGPQWLEALFESSWASYRLGKYEQALGNLVTLSSPFFKDEYFPEALVLKAVVYYENCRYTEALVMVQDFERIYGPVEEELKTLVDKNMAAAEYYNVLADVQKKNKESGGKLRGTDQILERILNLALTDKDLKKTSDSIGELEAEIDGFSSKGDAFKFSNLVKSLIESMKAEREKLIEKAGVLAKGKLETELGALKDLHGKVIRIRIETTDKEKTYLEAQLQGGANRDQLKKIKVRWGVKDTELMWMYSGEYWRDELGTYEYTLTKGCTDRSGAITDDNNGGSAGGGQ